MSGIPDNEITEVTICGCGPTGAILSVLLSQLGVSNICLDREESIATDPRGIALDEDGIRALQSVGILDKIYSEIGRCMGIFNFVGGVHSDLQAKPFMRMDYGTSEGGTGHVGFICHKQPTLEKHVRSRINEELFSQLRTSSVLTSIVEDDDWVYATYTDSLARQRKIQCRFFVGADGKKGFTRKKYLEPQGVIMEQISRIGSYAETWVAMNLHFAIPTPITHPNFPLWQKGYAPQDVYDLFIPTDFRFLCNPDRPAVCGRFGQPEDQLFRFEYVVGAGEDASQMASIQKVKEIVFPYLTHPAQRYGLTHDVSYPEDCIEILRCRPFFFSARSCNVWAKGRVVLCGDAAHVFPPYGGQGIASGFRDAMSLAWRLKVACQRLPQARESLLWAWYLERKQQLEHSLAATVENGRYVTERNAFRIFARDTYLWFLQLIPSWRRWLEMGARKDGMCRYVPQSGLHFLAEGGGVLLPQVYCRLLIPASSQILFSDDVIFSPDKKGLLQLVVVLDSADKMSAALSELQNLDIDTISDEFVSGSETTFLVCDLAATSNKASQLQPISNKSKLVRVASGEEFARSSLCQDRPAPRYYDPQRIARELPQKRFILVRPDRFTFAACAKVEELREALRNIRPVLNGDYIA